MLQYFSHFSTSPLAFSPPKLLHVQLCVHSDYSFGFRLCTDTQQMYIERKHVLAINLAFKNENNLENCCNICIVGILFLLLLLLLYTNLGLCAARAFHVQA